METMIELKDVNKTIKQQVILDHVSLRIPKGGIYGFVGRNGSGKSMLFKAICGFISVDSGSIIVDHKRIGEEIDFPMNMGVIIEKPALIPYMTGMDNLRYLASIQKKLSYHAIGGAGPVVEEKSTGVFAGNEAAIGYCAGNDGRAGYSYFG